MSLFFRPPFTMTILLLLLVVLSLCVQQHECCGGGGGGGGGGGCGGGGHGGGGGKKCGFKDKGCGYKEEKKEKKEKKEKGCKYKKKKPSCADDSDSCDDSGGGEWKEKMYKEKMYKEKMYKEKMYKEKPCKDKGKKACMAVASLLAKASNRLDSTGDDQQHYVEKVRAPAVRYEYLPAPVAAPRPVRYVEVPVERPAPIRRRPVPVDDYDDYDDSDDNQLHRIRAGARYPEVRASAPRAREYVYEQPSGARYQEPEYKYVREREEYSPGVLRSKLRDPIAGRARVYPESEYRLYH